MFACPCGNVFIGSINTIGEQKDAHYICNVLVGYIETIGVDNIVQICVGNGLNMRSVDNLLIHHFPKKLLSKLCYSLFGLAIGKLGENNMGETNCEKDDFLIYFSYGNTMHY
jgi:hypothetical protein